MPLPQFGRTVLRQHSNYSKLALIMVLFLIISSPLLYMFVLQFQKGQLDLALQIRNPLVIGGASFFFFALLGTVVWPLFNNDYLWANAFLAATLGDQVIPFAVAFMLYTVFFRKTFFNEGTKQEFTLFSFLVGFMTLLAMRDLTVSVNELSPVELFFRPTGRLCLLVIIPWTLSAFFFNRRSLKLLVANILVVQLLLGVASAELRMNHPIIALLFIALPVAEGVFIFFRPDKFKQLLNRAIPA